MKRFGEADYVLGINKTSMRHLPGQSWCYTGAISGTKLARPTQKTAVCASSARNAKRAAFAFAFAWHECGSQTLRHRSWCKIQFCDLYLPWLHAGEIKRTRLASSDDALLHLSRYMKSQTNRYRSALQFPVNLTRYQGWCVVCYNCN